MSNSSAASEVQLTLPFKTVKIMVDPSFADDNARIFIMDIDTNAVLMDTDNVPRNINLGVVIGQRLVIRAISFNYKYHEVTIDTTNTSMVAINPLRETNYQS